MTLVIFPLPRTCLHWCVAAPYEDKFLTEGREHTEGEWNFPLCCYQLSISPRSSSGLPSVFSFHEAYGSELVLFVVAQVLRLSTTLLASLSSKDLLLFILGVPAQASLAPAAVPWLGNPRRPRSWRLLCKLIRCGRWLRHHSIASRRQKATRIVDS